MSRDFERSSSQYLSNASAVISGYPYTIALWAKTEDLTVNQGLFTIGTAGANNHRITILQNITTGTISLISRTTGSAIATTSTSVSAGTWAHVCAIGASATDRKIYLNGGGEGTNATSNTPSGMDTTYIGAVPGAAVVSFFDGLLAEVAVWNVALSSSEKDALAARVSPLRIRPASIAAYWPIFGVGSPEPSYVGAFPMTLTNAPVVADHAPVAPPFFIADWFGAFTAAAPGGGVGLPVISEGGYSPIFGGMVVR
jgi:hypothetical protein